MLCDHILWGFFFPLLVNNGFLLTYKYPVCYSRISQYEKYIIRPQKIRFRRSCKGTRFLATHALSRGWMESTRIGAEHSCLLCLRITVQRNSM